MPFNNAIYGCRLLTYDWLSVCVGSHCSLFFIPLNTGILVLFYMAAQFLQCVRLLRFDNFHHFLVTVKSYHRVKLTWYSKVASLIGVKPITDIHYSKYGAYSHSDSVEHLIQHIHCGNQAGFGCFVLCC